MNPQNYSIDDTTLEICYDVALERDTFTLLPIKDILTKCEARGISEQQCRRAIERLNAEHYLVPQTEDNILRAIIIFDKGFDAYLRSRLPAYENLRQEVAQLLAEGPDTPSEAIASALNQPVIVIRHLRGEPVVPDEPFEL